MSEKDGGPAFPETRWDDKTRQEVQWCGMALRDYFAAKALQGLLSSPQTIRGLGSEAERRGIVPNICVARCAYEYADAMLQARQS